MDGEGLFSQCTDPGMTNIPCPKWCRVRHGGLIRYIPLGRKSPRLHLPTSGGITFQTAGQRELEEFRKEQCELWMCPDYCCDPQCTAPGRATVPNHQATACLQVQLLCSRQLQRSHSGENSGFDFVPSSTGAITTGHQTSDTVEARTTAFSFSPSWP